MKKLANRLQRANTNSQGMAIGSAAYAKGPDPDLNPPKWKESAPSKEDTTDGYEHPIPMNNKEAEGVLERKRARAEMSYLLPHLHSGWAVDQAILADFGVGAFYQSGEEDIRGASNLKVDDMKTLVEHVRRQIFSEALEVLITHLEQEKAERKQRKKEKKLQKAVAKAQNMQQRKCADSSSSSSESSDGDSEEINMANLRMNWIPEQAVWPDVMPATFLENPLNSGGLDWEFSETTEKYKGDCCCNLCNGSRISVCSQGEKVCNGLRYVQQLEWENNRVAEEMDFELEHHRVDRAEIEECEFMHQFAPVKVVRDGVRLFDFIALDRIW